MSYTATQALIPQAFAAPRGVDNTQRNSIVRGVFVQNHEANYLTAIGMGCNTFEITAFSAVGLVTYETLLGQPLSVGMQFNVDGTSDNDGNYTVASIVSATQFYAAGVLSGTAETGKTAQGTGAIQFGSTGSVPQSCTVASVVATGSTIAFTYTTLVGPQFQAGQLVVVAGCSNAGNNGNFYIASATTSSATAGTFIVNAFGGASTDSGTASGSLAAGLPGVYDLAPTEVDFQASLNGVIYVWDPVHQTVRVFLAGTATDALDEAATAKAIALDTIQFTAVFPRI